MRFLLALLAALLTFAFAAVVLRALLSFRPGALAVGAVAFGATEKLLTSLLAVLSALFIVLLAIYRRRERRKRT